MSHPGMPAQAPQQYFDIDNDCLLIGGIPLTTLTERVGSTPYYAYDRSVLDRRVRELRDTLPAGLSLHYAMKANPMPAVVGHMASLVDGLDVASAGELRVALNAGVPPAEISFAGPGKQPWELQAAMASGITLNVESFTELDRISEIADRQGIQANVAIRVNPDFELKSSGMKMGGGPKAFGVDAERVPEMLEIIGKRGLHFRGLHIYTGSQNLRAESIIEAHDHIFDLAYRLSDHAPGPYEFLNIGGGFGIPYFPGDTPLPVSPIAERLADHMDQARQHLGNAEIVMELGRYLVGEAGVYVARIVDRKVSRDRVFLITDGGLHHHLAASGNFGQIIRKNYPVIIGNRVQGRERETATVTGPLCTPLDLLAEKVDLARAEPGDLVVVFQSGAYGYTASPTRFLSHPEPAEILV